ncbi:hypothetical protein Mucpa_6506 [Mucilaginibacter paludis DSM 18603]|uniref:Uncharacterized protein n=1 Tax=Mucilaginibacter paludis DSM 18603 TaxID=714943 RepID=H1Y9Q7_9SPHI|nr:hypothetical protein Mucpa_6506 [Mucilaginibacter paludis DSM 18603]
MRRCHQQQHVAVELRMLGIIDVGKNVIYIKSIGLIDKYINSMLLVQIFWKLLCIYANK